MGQKGHRGGEGCADIVPDELRSTRKATMLVPGQVRRGIQCLLYRNREGGLERPEALIAVDAKVLLNVRSPRAVFRYD